MPRHATPCHAIREWADGREGSRQRTASRGKLRRTRRPCPCRCGGQGASRSRCARSWGRRRGLVSACFSNQLGDSVRRREAPLVRVLGDLCAVLEPAARVGVEVGACVCERAWSSSGGGTVPTPRVAPNAYLVLACAGRLRRLRKWCASVPVRRENPKRSVVHKGVQITDRRGCPESGARRAADREQQS